MKEKDLLGYLNLFINADENWIKEGSRATLENISTGMILLKRKSLGKRQSRIRYGFALVHTVKTYEAIIDIGYGLDTLEERELGLANLFILINQKEVLDELERRLNNKKDIV